MDREAWHAVIHGVAKSRTLPSDWTELNWTELRMWEGKGWQELEWQSCSLLPKVAAPVPLGRGRADFGRPQIWELGGKFGCGPIRPMTRLGSSCHAMPGAQASAPRLSLEKGKSPWHLDTESWASSGQEQGSHCHTQHLPAPKLSLMWKEKGT